MLKHFTDLKRRYPTLVLLFLVGDFYETYCEDAETVGKVCRLTITTRHDGGHKTAMVGFPHHAIDGHLRALLVAGHRVAICEPVATAPKGKPVERIVGAGAFGGPGDIE